MLRSRGFKRTGLELISQITGERASTRSIATKVIFSGVPFKRANAIHQEQLSMGTFRQLVVYLVIGVVMTGETLRTTVLIPPAYSKVMIVSAELDFSLI